MNDALHQQSSTETERILFLTGRLAEPSVQKVVAELSEKIGFQYEIEVLGVSVCCLNACWHCQKTAQPGTRLPVPSHYSTRLVLW